MAETDCGLAARLDSAKPVRKAGSGGAVCRGVKEAGVAVSADVSLILPDELSLSTYHTAARHETETSSATTASLI